MSDSISDNLDYHQELMNAAYARWRERRGSYEEFIGSLNGSKEVAVLVGNLNYQVGNGGFEQWHFNEYSDCSEDLIRVLETMKEECPLAKKALSLVREALEIIEEEKEVCESDYYYYEDDENDAWDLAEQERQSILGGLDSLGRQYYDFDDAFMVQVELYLRRMDGLEIPQSTLDENKEILEMGKEIPEQEPGPKKPKVKLTGTNGNAFAIMAKVSRALRQVGCSHDYIEDYRKEAMSGSYDNLLAVSCRYADVR
ncbi:MAG: DUF4375 domain-containing protein [Candidatus Altiarchaeales archaeon]|nr:DUF4375 domain-containing protein [Candidatus Altiarchaeales archaeon]